MLDVLFGIVIILMSYLFGCFSTARVLAKTFRSLNIYKIGTGHPDTENIYKNVSKPLGILAGAIDISKIYFSLILLEFVLTKTIPSLANQNLMLVYGFAQLVGHCLPVTHHFKGGRGIFTYIGFTSYFAFWPMLTVCLLVLLIVIKYKQYRFAQFMIVLLPPIFLVIGNAVIPYLHEPFRNVTVMDNIFNYLEKTLYSPQIAAKLLIAAILIGVINVIVSKKLGEI